MKNKNKKPLYLNGGELLTAGAPILGTINPLLGIAASTIGGAITSNKESRRIIEANEKLKEEQKYQTLIRDLMQNREPYNPNIPTFENGGELDVIKGYPHEQGGTNIGNIAEAEVNETKEGNYIYSDNIKIGKEEIDNYGLNIKYKGMTFAEASKKIDKKFNLRTNDSIDSKERKRQLNKLQEAQDNKRNKIMLKEKNILLSKYPELATSFLSQQVQESQAKKELHKMPDGTVMQGNEHSIDNPNQNLQANQQGVNAEGLPKYLYGGIVTNKGLLETQTLPNWRDPNYIKEMETAFNDVGTFQEFKDYYKRNTNKDFIDPHDKVLNVLKESRTKNLNSNNLVPEWYGETTDASGVPTLPTLVKFYEGFSNRQGQNNFNLSNKQNKVSSNQGKNSNNQGNTNTIVTRGANSGITSNAIVDNHADVSKKGKNKVSGVGNYLLSNMGNLYDVFRGIKALNRPEKETGRVITTPVNAVLSDPQRAIQDVRTSYGNITDSIRQNATSVGNFLSNRLAAANLESDTIAKIHNQYSSANQRAEQIAQGINVQQSSQADRINIGQSNLEEQINQQERDAAMNTIQGGLSGLGQSYSQFSVDNKKEAIQKKIISMIGSEDYKLKWIPSTNSYEVIWSGDTFNVDEEGNRIQKFSK